ncbi:hypothetical protein TcYC6_0127950 [Trypanosoma cruzi]|nr:hypothetical protein TcYC6_0127950 [Trypanosoma cruzi]
MTTKAIITTTITTNAQETLHRAPVEKKYGTVRDDCKEGEPPRFPSAAVAARSSSSPGNDDDMEAKDGKAKAAARNAVGSSG